MVSLVIIVFILFYNSTTYITVCLFFFLLFFLFVPLFFVRSLSCHPPEWRIAVFLGFLVSPLPFSSRCHLWWFQPPWYGGLFCLCVFSSYVKIRYIVDLTQIDDSEGFSLLVCKLSKSFQSGIAMTIGRMHMWWSIVVYMLWLTGQHLLVKLFSSWNIKLQLIGSIRLSSTSWDYWWPTQWDLPSGGRLCKIAKGWTSYRNVQECFSININSKWPSVNASFPPNSTTLFAMAKVITCSAAISSCEKGLHKMLPLLVACVILRSFEVGHPGSLHLESIWDPINVCTD